MHVFFFPLFLLVKRYIFVRPLKYGRLWGSCLAPYIWPLLYLFTSSFSPCLPHKKNFSLQGRNGCIFFLAIYLNFPFLSSLVFFPPFLFLFFLFLPGHGKYQNLHTNPPLSRQRGINCPFEIYSEQEPFPFLPLHHWELLFIFPSISLAYIIRSFSPWSGVQKRFASRKFIFHYILFSDTQKDHVWPWFKYSPVIFFFSLVLMFWRVFQQLLLFSIDFIY